MSLCCFTMDRPKTAPVRSDNFSFRINKQIDDDIKLEKKRHRNRTKMLLLGCGEAGKVVNGRGDGGDRKECVMFQSTFIKQMKIIHSGEEEGGWSEEERIKYR